VRGPAETSTPMLTALSVPGAPPSLSSLSAAAAPSTPPPSPPPVPSVPPPPPSLPSPPLTPTAAAAAAAAASAGSASPCSSKGTTASTTPPPASASAPAPARGTSAACSRCCPAGSAGSCTTTSSGSDPPAPRLSCGSKSSAPASCRARGGAPVIALRPPRACGAAQGRCRSCGRVVVVAATVLVGWTSPSTRRTRRAPARGTLATRRRARRAEAGGRSCPPEGCSTRRSGSPKADGCRSRASWKVTRAETKLRPDAAETTARERVCTPARGSARVRWDRGRGFAAEARRVLRRPSDTCSPTVCLCPPCGEQRLVGKDQRLLRRVELRDADAVELQLRPPPRRKQRVRNRDLNLDALGPHDAAIIRPHDLCPLFCVRRRLCSGAPGTSRGQQEAQDQHKAPHSAQRQGAGVTPPQSRAIALFGV